MALEGAAQIETSILAGDAAALSRVAHSLKSGTANVGADTLSAHYRRLEKLGREHNLDEARELLVQVRQQHDRALLQVQDILAEPA